jgi:hypothetical protein
MGIKIRLIEGTPLTIGEKKLTPVVRAISWHQRRAEVRRDSVNGSASSVTWLQPVAVLEETAEGRRRIPIGDETNRVVLSLLAVALAVSLVLGLLVRLVEVRD